MHCLVFSQASSLAMEYQQRKMHEDLLKKQADVSKTLGFEPTEAM